MLNSAKDGVANIEMRSGVDVNNLKIRFEYEYVGETQIDPEIESVVKVFKSSYFPKSETIVTGVPQGLLQVGDGTDPIPPINDDKSYRIVIKDIASTIATNNYSSIKSLFTNEGWEMMNELLNYGNAKLFSQQKYNFYQMEDGRVVCRSLVMSFAFPNNNRTFTEDVTFTFNKDGLVESLAFGLGSEAKDDILNSSNDSIGESSRLAIVSFLENYKTAFALKRLDYIKSIFDDNAIIITGHVVKQTKNNDKVKDGATPINISNDVVRYNKFNKEQYLRHLEKVFSRNEFVNIRFANNDVRKMTKGGELYGIFIHQDYYSSTYGDTGYLFLLFDINDPQKPTIIVRTWQPERDPNVNNKFSRDNEFYGLIGPWSFE